MQTPTSTQQGESQAVDAKQPEGAATAEPSLKDLQEQFESIKTDFQKREELYKKEISGLNRKISESEKAIQAKELEKLSEVEREKAEAAILKAEKEKLLRETEEIRRDRIKEKALIDAGLPTEFMARVKGETAEEIQADIKALKTFVENAIKAGIEKEINARLGGKAPEGGAAPKKNAMNRTEYNALSADNKIKFTREGGIITD